VLFRSGGGNPDPEDDNYPPPGPPGLSPDNPFIVDIGPCDWRIVELAYNVTYLSSQYNSDLPTEYTAQYYGYNGYMAFQKNCGSEWETMHSWTTLLGAPTVYFRYI
jgi:hypothetical protein